MRVVRQRQAGVLLLAGREFLHRSELHQDSGEGLRQAVVDLLADARALHQHRGLLRLVGQAGKLHGERRLLGERHQQLAALHVGRVAAEAQDEEADVAGAEHQRIDDAAGVAFLAVEGQHARPELLRLLLDVEIHRLGRLGEAIAEGGAVHRYAHGVGWLLDAAVVHVGGDAPLLQAVLGDHHGAGGGLELAGRLEQHVLEEAVQVGLARQALEVAADHRVGFGELRHALLGGALALPSARRR